MISQRDAWDGVTASISTDRLLTTLQLSGLNLRRYSVPKESPGLCRLQFVWGLFVHPTPKVPAAQALVELHRPYNAYKNSKTSKNITSRTYKWLLWSPVPSCLIESTGISDFLMQSEHYSKEKDSWKKMTLDHRVLLSVALSLSSDHPGIQQGISKLLTLDFCFTWCILEQQKGSIEGGLSLQQLFNAKEQWLQWKHLQNTKAPLPCSQL